MQMHPNLIKKYHHEFAQHFFSSFVYFNLLHVTYSLSKYYDVPTSSSGINNISSIENDINDHIKAKDIKESRQTSFAFFNYNFKIYLKSQLKSALTLQCTYTGRGNASRRLKLN